MTTSLPLSEVYGLLNAAVRTAGGESAFARKHGLTRQDVHEAMKSNRHPGPGMLAAVGIRKVVTVRYEPIAASGKAVAVPEPGTCACPVSADRSCMNPACPRQPAHLRQISAPEAA